MPRHRWLYYEYDTGELLSLHLLQLPHCADIKQNNNCCLAWQHALVDPQLVHAFAGHPEDAISRKRKLYLEHERYFVTDAGGKHTHQTPDVFNNQQIMQTSGRPLKVINIGRLSADAGQPETASQPSCAAEAADQTEHSASAQKENVTCSASEVANQLQQLQQDNCSAFSEHWHDPTLTAAGMLPYYCSRGPKPPQTFIRQYLPLGELPQRRSTATCKQAGCQCNVRLIYPEGSYHSKCPVTGKEWLVGSVPHKALQQQQEALQQPPQQAALHEPLQAPADAQVVTIVKSLQHSGHEPGSDESIKYLPIYEVGSQLFYESSMHVY